jgi:hypothetical protein
MNMSTSLRNSTQIGGSHYCNMEIQPIDFINANNLGFAEGCVIKYVCRHGSKGNIDDIKKAIHYLETIIKRDYDTDKKICVHEVKQEIAVIDLTK